MEINIILIKQIAILSALLGGIGGAIALLPPLTLWMFLLAFICPAILVLVYLKQNSLIGIINTREGCIFGAIIGFVSFISSFIVYAPVSIFVGWFVRLFKITYVPGFLRFVPFDFGSIVVLLISVVFAAVMSALFNGFGGLVTAYVYEIITGIKKERNENNSIDFEIK